MSTQRRIYKALGINEPKFLPATFRDAKIDTGDHVFPLDTFLAKGAFGIVFATKTYVIKIEDSYSENLNEADITQFASREGIGPLVWMRGELRISQQEIRDFIESLEKKGIYPPLNTWDDMRYWYTITERWSTSLGSYLELGGKKASEAFLELDPAIVQKIIDLARKMHKAKLVHLDLHSDNILVNVENGVITDVKLTDFGTSMLRSQYFYGYGGQIRYARIAPFLESRIFTQLATAVAKLAPRLNQKDALERWLINEPVNIDLARVYAYALQHPSHKFTDLPELTMPDNFRFELPWQEADVLRKVRIKINDVISDVTLDIFGKMKVSAIRKMVTNRIPEAEGMRFVHGEKGDGSLIELEAESNLYCRVLPVKVEDQVLIEMREE